MCYDFYIDDGGILDIEPTLSYIYMYDADGSPMGMRYRKESYGQYVYDTFWFDKNLQGDIVAVYDENGTKLISYKYDAWGNFTTTYHNGCTLHVDIFRQGRVRFCSPAVQKRSMILSEVFSYRE